MASNQIQTVVNVQANTQQANQNLASTSQQLQGLAQATGAQTGAFNLLNNASGGLIGTLGGFAGTASGFVTGIRAMTLGTSQFAIALAATGIGLITAALAILIDYFKSFTPLMDLVEQVVAGVAAAFQILQNAMGSLFTSEPTPSMEELADSMAQAYKDAKNLEKAMQDLEDAMAEQEIATAKTRAEIDKINIQAKDRTKSEEERLALLKKAQKLEQEDFDKRKKLADKELANRLEKIRIQAGLDKQEFEALKKNGLAYKEHIEAKTNDVDELFEALKSAQLARIALDSEENNNLEKNINKQNKIEDDKAEKEAKRAEEAQKRNEEAVKKREEFLNKVKSLEQKFANDIESLNAKTEQQKLDLQKKRDEEELAALRLKGDKKLAIQKQIDEKFRILQADLDQKAIDKRNEVEKKYANDVENLEADTAQKKLDLQKKREQAEIDSLVGTAEQKAKIQKEFNEKFRLLQKEVDDKEIEDRIKFLEKYQQREKEYKDAKDEEEIQKIADKKQADLDLQEEEQLAKAELLGANLEELQLIRDAYDAKERENKAAQAQAVADLEKKKYELVKGFANQGMAVMDSLEKLGIVKGKAAQKIKKALTLAQIGADTASAISSLVKGSEATGAAAGPAYLPTKIATFAAGIIPILANIAKAKQLLSSSESGGGGDASAAGGGASAAPAPPQFNVVGASSQNMLAETIAQSQGAPVLAQVVSSQVQSQAALERNVLNNATFY